MRILASQEAATAWGTERNRNKKVFEKGAFFGDSVYVGRFRKGMTGATQRVPAQIIDENKDDVWGRF